MKQRLDEIVLQGFTTIGEIEFGLRRDERASQTVLERVRIDSVLLACTDGMNLVDQSRKIFFECCESTGRAVDGRYWFTDFVELVAGRPEDIAEIVVVLYTRSIRYAVRKARTQICCRGESGKSDIP
jgi:hypothetical protein